jgi:hypothetical protein
LVVLLIVIGVLAFFPLALAFGADSRPDDREQRRALKSRCPIQQ